MPPVFGKRRPYIPETVGRTRTGTMAETMRSRSQDAAERGHDDNEDGPRARDDADQGRAAPGRTAQFDSRLPLPGIGGWRAAGRPGGASQVAPQDMRELRGRGGCQRKARGWGLGRHMAAPRRTPGPRLPAHGSPRRHPCAGDVVPGSALAAQDSLTPQSARRRQPPTIMSPTHGQGGRAPAQRPALTPGSGYACNNADPAPFRTEKRVIGANFVSIWVGIRKPEAARTGPIWRAAIRPGAGA